MLTLEAQIKAIENELKKTISNQDFLLKNVLDAYEGKCKSKDSTQRGDNRKVSVSNFKPNKQQSNNNSCEEDKGFCLEQATLREGRERRRKKAQDKCERVGVENLLTKTKAKVIYEGTNEIEGTHESIFEVLGSRYFCGKCATLDDRIYFMEVPETVKNGIEARAYLSNLDPKKCIGAT